nr:GIY-YIG nuclease family protein [Cytophagales bacterium]
MPYFVYIIQSKLDGTYYIGASKDPYDRLEKHNRPHKGFTARKQPWKLVYTEAFESKTQALKRENYLKKLKSRSLLEELISGSSAD